MSPAVMLIWGGGANAPLSFKNEGWKRGLKGCFKGLVCWFGGDVPAASSAVQAGKRRGAGWRVPPLMTATKGSVLAAKAVEHRRQRQCLTGGSAPGACRLAAEQEPTTVRLAGIEDD